MQADLFYCSFCSESYDLELHIPKFLISCSHYLCLKCLRNIFINHSPHQRQCPSCNTRFLSSIDTPEDFPTDPTLLQLLQTRPKAELGDRTEQALDAKKDNEQADLLHDNVQKKQKTEQEVDHALIKLEAFIVNQFQEIRKMMPNVRNEKKKGSARTMTHDKTELMRKEELVNNQNELPLAQITKKLKGISNKTGETLDRVLEAGELLKLETTQINEVFTQKIQDISQSFQDLEMLSSLSSENEEEQNQIKIETSSSFKTNTFNIFQNSNDENWFALKPKITIKGTRYGEEKFDEEEEKSLSKDDQFNEKEIQGRKN